METIDKYIYAVNQNKLAKVIALQGDIIILQIAAQPRSSVTRWGKVINQDRIQLKISSPPVDNAANEACIKYIAKEFKCSKSNVKLIKGDKSKLKTFSISNWDNLKLEKFLQTFNLEL